MVTGDAYPDELDRREDQLAAKGTLAQEHLRSARAHDPLVQLGRQQQHGRSNAEPEDVAQDAGSQRDVAKELRRRVIKAHGEKAAAQKAKAVVKKAAKIAAKRAVWWAVGALIAFVGWPAIIIIALVLIALVIVMIYYNDLASVISFSELIAYMYG